MEVEVKEWRIYRGHARISEAPEEEEPLVDIPSDHPLAKLPAPPLWRRFNLAERAVWRARVFQPNKQLIDVVNMALYLRRPLLITGKPGTGKSSLAWAIADELQLGSLLTWSITTRSTLQDGLYTYDAIRRLEDVQIYDRRRVSKQIDNQAQQLDDPANDIGHYIRLGPLGTAMLANHYDSTRTSIPRALLIDEIDKSDLDLPNDLLNVLEEGEFEIPEITRHQLRTKQQEVRIKTSDGKDWKVQSDGKIHSKTFPVIIMTSNGERDFPAAFMRRCLRYDIPQPDADDLTQIVRAHLGKKIADNASHQIAEFARRSKAGDTLATDQLLNLLYLLGREVEISDEARKALLRDLVTGM